MNDEAGAKTTINLKVSQQMLQELRQEMNRTGHTRTALLRIAWQEYIERHPPRKP